jgi:hypothetical protein
MNSGSGTGNFWIKLQKIVEEGRMCCHLTIKSPKEKKLERKVIGDGVGMKE